MCFNMCLECIERLYKSIQLCPKTRKARRKGIEHGFGQHLRSLVGDPKSLDLGRMEISTTVLLYFDSKLYTCL